ncbi:MAG: hypothetical protein Q4P05_08545 [Actinomycetaceae bacterium]|nr:hypothetical protein [Actinomycetaceae bacterium]
MAIALAHAPDLLILDEATSGLDPLARSELVNTLREFMLDENHSVWFSTHITSDLESLADYLIVIDRGSIFAQRETHCVVDTDDYCSARFPRVPVVWNPNTGYFEVREPKSHLCPSRDFHILRDPAVNFQSVCSTS